MCVTNNQYVLSLFSTHTDLCLNYFLCKVHQQGLKGIQSVVAYTVLAKVISENEVFTLKGNLLSQKLILR